MKWGLEADGYGKWNVRGGKYPINIRQIYTLEESLKPSNLGFGAFMGE